MDEEQEQANGNETGQIILSLRRSKMEGETFQAISREREKSH